MKRAHDGANKDDHDHEGNYCCDMNDGDDASIVNQANVDKRGGVGGSGAPPKYDGDNSGAGISWPI